MTSTELLSKKLHLLSEIEYILNSSSKFNINSNKDFLRFQDMIYKNPYFAINISEDTELVIHFRSTRRPASLHTPIGRIVITEDISSNTLPFLDLYSTYKDCDDSYIRLSINQKLYSILDWLSISFLENILKRIKEEIDVGQGVY